MDSFGAFWHLANFFAAPLGLGLIAAALTRLLWRRSLASVPWTRLAAWAIGAAVLADLCGLVLTGQDGKMLSYGSMVAASAVALWWAGRR